MNYTDLLYTNQFIKDEINAVSNIVSNTVSNTVSKPLENSINTEIKDNEITELKKYLKKELSSKKTENDTIRNFDMTNIDPYLFYERPLSLSSSVQPLFNGENDLKTRYRKHIHSFLNVDSRQRNTKEYPNPANYNIYINKEFKYIQSIYLKIIEFREALTPINESNNKISWITDYTGLLNEDMKVEYSTIIPCSFYSLESFVQYVEASMNSIQHYIPDNELNGLYPNFGLYINPFTRALKLIERLELLPIDTLTTNKNSNQILITMTYQPLNSVSPDCKLNNGEGYPFKPDFEDVPILFTGLDLFYQEYGNIPSIGILDAVPFYTKNQVDNNPTLHNKSYYECNGHMGVFRYYLYVYDHCGNPANASYTKTYDMTATSSLLSNPTFGHPLQVVVGRVVPVEILTNSISTFGSFLGLTTANKSVYLNINYVPETRTVINKIPWKVSSSGQLVLSTDEYIFMRIGTIAHPFETISDNLTDANGGSSNMQIESCKENYFFAKIIFSDKDPGDVSIKSIGGIKVFYDAPLVSLSDLSVQFILSNGKIMNLFQNHSFTLEIVELREVLNDTLMDSRTGNIINIGNHKNH